GTLQDEAVDTTTKRAGGEGVPQLVRMNMDPRLLRQPLHHQLDRSWRHGLEVISPQVMAGAEEHVPAPGLTRTYVADVRSDALRELRRRRVERNDSVLPSLPLPHP